MISPLNRTPSLFSLALPGKDFPAVWVWCRWGYHVLPLQTQACMSGACGPEEMLFPKLQLQNWLHRNATFNAYFSLKKKKKDWILNLMTIEAFEFGLFLSVSFFHYGDTLTSYDNFAVPLNICLESQQTCLIVCFYCSFYSMGLLKIQWNLMFAVT